MNPKIRVNIGALSEKSRRSWNIPEFWEDIHYQCRDCRAECVFPAETQRDWYERQKRYIWQRPNRCLKCRKVRNQKRIAKTMMDGRLGELKKHPDDESTIANAILAIVHHHRLNNTGDLQFAIALSRRLSENKQASRAVRDATDYCATHVVGQADRNSTPKMEEG